MSFPPAHAIRPSVYSSGPRDVLALCAVLVEAAAAAARVLTYMRAVYVGMPCAVRVEAAAVAAAAVRVPT